MDSQSQFNQTIIKSETVKNVDAEGNETTSIKETSYKRSGEPDYIKLYTNVWLEFNGIELKYRGLFLELAQRMTYCNSNDLKNAQLVNTGKPWSTQIMQALNWQESMYRKGLKALCDKGAIRKVARGVYQINPNYAGRGEWRYNSKLERGGVQDLVSEFDFVNGTVKTSIVWADDGSDDEYNESYRNGLGSKKDDNTVLKYTRKQNLG